MISPSVDMNSILLDGSNRSKASTMALKHPNSYFKSRSMFYRCTLSRIAIKSMPSPESIRARVCSNPLSNRRIIQSNKIDFCTDWDGPNSIFIWILSMGASALLQLSIFTVSNWRNDLDKSEYPMRKKCKRRTRPLFTFSCFVLLVNFYYHFLFSFSFPFFLSMGSFFLPFWALLFVMAEEWPVREPRWLFPIKFHYEWRLTWWICWVRLEMLLHDLSPLEFFFRLYLELNGRNAGLFLMNPRLISSWFGQWVATLSNRRWNTTEFLKQSMGDSQQQQQQQPVFGSFIAVSSFFLISFSCSFDLIFMIFVFILSK